MVFMLIYPCFIRDNEADGYPSSIQYDRSIRQAVAKEIREK